MKPVTPQIKLQEIPDSYIVSTARQYREAADHLYSLLPSHNFVGPLVMVATFGIELFLKAMNAKFQYHQDDRLKALGGYKVTSKPEAHGHALIPLLEAIRPEYREALEAAYSQKPAVSGKPTLREALIVYDGLFVDNRYWYEKPSSHRGENLTSLVRLLGMIADHVESVPRQKFVVE